MCPSLMNAIIYNGYGFGFKRASELIFKFVGKGLEISEKKETVSQALSRKSQRTAVEMKAQTHSGFSICRSSKAI